MNNQTLETLKIISSCTGILSGLFALRCVYKGFVEGENNISQFATSASIAVASVFGFIYANEKLEDIEYKKIPATCVKITEGLQNQASYGVTPVTGISMGSGNVVMGHATTRYSHTVPYQYFFFDTDNNPETIEYIGEVENSPQLIAKHQNAGIKVGKTMNLYQWKQFVSKLEKVY